MILLSDEIIRIRGMYYEKKDFENRVTTWLDELSEWLLKNSELVRRTREFIKSAPKEISNKLFARFLVYESIRAGETEILEFIIERHVSYVDVVFYERDELQSIIRATLLYTMLP
ncbi:hypothetical protein DRN86_02025 [Candidatus Geothermarchaeota archaeon]|nr:MAG: hypothetical protein DRN86_02025 [Candidatus Geothermarchaeota archaeon]